MKNTNKVFSVARRRKGMNQLETNRLLKKISCLGRKIIITDSKSELLEEKKNSERIIHNI